MICSVLLASDSVSMKNPLAWRICFEKLLLPLLDSVANFPLTTVPTSPSSSASASPAYDIAVKAASLLFQVFLHHLDTLLLSPDFTVLWLRLLGSIHKHTHSSVSGSGESRAAVHFIESLKNVLLVMQASGVWDDVQQRSGQDVWALTTQSIDQFKPEWRDELKECLGGRSATRYASSAVALSAPLPMSHRSASAASDELSGEVSVTAFLRQQPAAAPALEAAPAAPFTNGDKTSADRQSASVNGTAHPAQSHVASAQVPATAHPAWGSAVSCCRCPFCLSGHYAVPDAGSIATLCAATPCLPIRHRHSSSSTHLAICCLSCAIRYVISASRASCCPVSRYFRSVIVPSHSSTRRHCAFALRLASSSSTLYLPSCSSSGRRSAAAVGASSHSRCVCRALLCCRAFRHFSCWTGRLSACCQSTATIECTSCVGQRLVCCAASLYTGGDSLPGPFSSLAHVHYLSWAASALLCCDYRCCCTTSVPTGGCYAVYEWCLQWCDASCGDGACGQQQWSESDACTSDRCSSCAFRWGSGRVK